LNQRLVACTSCLSLFWIEGSFAQSTVCEYCCAVNQAPDHVETPSTNQLVNEVVRRTNTAEERRHVIDELKKACDAADASLIPIWLRKIIPEDQGSWIALLALAVALLSLIRDVTDDGSAQIARILQERLPQRHAQEGGQHKQGDMRRRQAFKLTPGEILVQHIGPPYPRVRSTLGFCLVDPGPHVNSIDLYAEIGGEGGPLGWPDGHGRMGKVWRLSNMSRQVDSPLPEWHAVLRESRGEGESDTDLVSRVFVKNSSKVDVWLGLFQPSSRSLKLQHRDRKVNPIRELPEWALELIIDGSPIYY